MDYLLLRLRLTHTLVGIFWVGGALTVAGFVEPVVVAMGPEDGRFMQRLGQHQRLRLALRSGAALLVLAAILIAIARYLSSRPRPSVPDRASVGHHR